MAKTVKETALKLAMQAYALSGNNQLTITSVAREFEEYLLEAPNDQTLIERDQARARVVALEQELAGKGDDRAVWALRAVLKQAREGCKGLDRLLVESTVEIAAESIGVTL